MNPTRITLFSLLCIALLTCSWSCKKDDSTSSETITPTPTDARDQYVGSYQFNSFSRIQYSLVNPHTAYENSDFLGVIEKYGQNQLKVTFKSPSAEPLIQLSFPMSIKGLVYLTLGDSGRLSYPALTDEGNYFSGIFISKDSIRFGYGMSANLGSEDDVVSGRRK